MGYDQILDIYSKGGSLNILSEVKVLDT